MITPEYTHQKERPSYWKETQHSMTRRNIRNNYHSGHKAYMVTLKIEGMTPLLGQVVSFTQSPAQSPSACSATCCGIEGAAGGGIEAARCLLSPLGMAMRTAWLTLPERFHNITIIDSPEEFVIMPEHFHGIIYVTGYMEEHLSEVIRLFKARVAMSYRKLLVEYDEGQEAGAPRLTTRSHSNAFHAVGTSVRWLEAYRLQPKEIKIATKEWIDRQLAVLYSATCCGTQQDAPPFRVTASGKREKQGFLFATGYTDGLLLRTEDLDGHREYILRNPESRLRRSGNRTLLKANRTNIDTAVSVTALERYLLQECPPRDVTPEKLDAVRSLLMSSATCCGIGTGTGTGIGTGAGTGSVRQMIQCWSYGDRELLKRRLLPVVCHRRDAWQYGRQKARCMEEARRGAVIVSACISKQEQEIFNAIQEAGLPVVRIEDNGFPEIYHPSQERIDLCSEGRLLIVTPWKYHYRHTDENVFVAYCKTMNCIAQALCRVKDNWWK